MQAGRLGVPLAGLGARGRDGERVPVLEVSGLTARSVREISSSVSILRHKRNSLGFKG